MQYPIVTFLYGRALHRLTGAIVLVFLLAACVDQDLYANLITKGYVIWAASWA